MRKNVWVFNHYANNMYFNRAGRHFWFAKFLLKKGYKPFVFCSSTLHNSNNKIETGRNKYVTHDVEDIPFTFIKTPPYKNNGFRRIINMIAFYLNLFPVAKKFALLNEKPDIILASSVHPLTLVAGIKLAKKFKVPCICEVRDLWPESLVAYGSIKRSSIIAKLLYRGEKWIYKKADSIIMTWEGGKDYIIDQKWEKHIDLSKVIYISNGIDISEFDDNINENQINDSDINNKSYKNVVYTGSIRKVNNIGMLIDAAKIIQDQGKDEIRFLIYGTGDEYEKLKCRCQNESINNVIFKGKVDKKYIPYILKKANINILHNLSTSLDKYGQSQNKLFEYLSAGNCIIQTYKNKYSICEKYDCGITLQEQNAVEIANAIISFCNNDFECARLGENARNIAHEYDFSNLTEKLIDVIENI